MKQFASLLKKELAGYFLSYTAYFVIALYLFLSMISNFYLGAYFMSTGTDLYSFFYFQPQILMFLIPALAMRSWTEEKKSGTYELLLSYPVSYKSMVMAKFMASFLIAVMMIAMTFPLWIYTSLVANVDNYAVLCSYIGCFFVVAMFCSVVCLVSATNSSQVVSYLVSVFVLWLIVSVDYNFITKPLSYISSELFVTTQGAINFSNQFNAFLSAQIGLDNLIYFMSFIIVALILNKHIIEDRRDKSWVNLSIFTILLVFALVLLNVLSAMLFSVSKFDFTSDKKYTLSLATDEIVANLSEPIDVKVYISEDIRKSSPSLADYSKFVINYLEKYKQASNGKINIDVRTAERYSVAEREAIENKVSSFVGNNEDDIIYFGAVISNSSGNSQTINNFILDRKQYLESDITRAIYNLSKKNKKKIGWVNTLGISAYEKIILSALKDSYDIITISDQELEIPNDIDALVVVNLQNASRFLNYGVDQFLMRGKNVLAFVDAFSPQMKNLKVSAQIDSLLGQWGIGYAGNLSVVDNLLSAKKVVGEGSNKKIIDDVTSINTVKNNINQENQITSGLTNISFKTPALIGYYGDEGREGYTLIETSDKNGVTSTEYIRYFDDAYIRDNQEREDAPRPLALLVEGRAFSIFGKNIMSGTGFEKDMYPFLPISIEDAKFIVVSDAEVLDTSNWGYFGDEVTPYSLLIPNNNFDFLMKSLDYLSGNNQLLGVGGKEILYNNESVGEKIRARFVQKYSDEIALINKKASEKEEQIIELGTEVGKQFSMSKIKQLEDINKELGELREKAKYISYIILNETSQVMNVVIFCLSLVLPLVLCLFIFVFLHICRRVKKTKVLEMLNEK